MICHDHITILFPHDPESEHIAARLERELTSYCVPSDVAKRIGKHSISEITDPWLIVICTPETPSDWEINREIDRFIEQGFYSNILTLLTSDRPEQSFPRQLLTETMPDGTVRVHEPLAANIHAESEKEKLRRLKVEKLRLLAPMLGVTFDDLMNRRRRARNRILIAAGTAVLAGGILFLSVALTRKGTLSSQNKELNELYTQAENAREEARQQQARAQEEYVRTIAMTARNDFENGNVEAALTSCLSFLPEMHNVPELTETFEYILGKYCEDGYIPISKAADYRVTRELAFDTTDAYHRKDDLSREEDYSKEFAPPEDFETKNKLLSLKLCALSSDRNIHVYISYLDDLIRVCFASDPERDYYLRDDDGNLVIFDSLTSVTRDGLNNSIYNCVLANDRTLLFLKDGALYQADVQTGKVQAVSKKNGLPEDTEEYSFLLSPAGADVVFAFRGSKAEIWNREPFEYLTTIDGLEDIVLRGDANVLLGWQEGSLAVYRKNPFGYLYSIKRDDGTDQNALSSYLDTEVLSDGRSVLLYRYILYDLKDGTVIADYRDESTQSPMLSSEGYVLTTGYQTASVWDPISGKKLRTIRCVLNDRLSDTPNFQPYGPIDPVTGKRSVSAVNIGSRVYEYRSPCVMPLTLGEQIKLAEEILNNRDQLPTSISLNAQ